MQDRDEPRWLLKAIRETTSELEGQIWRLEHEQRRLASAPMLSAVALAAHLRDCEHRFGSSLRDVAECDGASIQAFDPDALEPASADGDLVSLLDEFDRLRRQTLDLLWMLHPRDWRRCGQHPYLGPVPLTALVREMHEHDLSHLWEVRRTLGG